MIDEHIEKSLDKVREIYKEAAAIIAALKSGEKIPATKLAADVAKKYNTTGPALYPTILILLEGYPGVIKKRGVQGGIWKI